MIDHLAWLATLAALAAMHTGGGPGIDGNIDAAGDVVLRDKIDGDRSEWRESVAREFDHLRSWIAILTGVIAVLIVTLAIISSLIILRFYRLDAQLESISILDAKIERLDTRVRDNERAILLQQLRERSTIP